MCSCVVVVCGCCCGVVVVSVVACLTCELCFGTSRSVLDPSWFGLRPFPCFTKEAASCSVKNHSAETETCNVNNNYFMETKKCNLVINRLNKIV